MVWFSKVRAMAIAMVPNIRNQDIFAWISNGSFENQTICKPTCFWPFEFQTSPDFKSPLQVEIFFWCRELQIQETIECQLNFVWGYKHKVLYSEDLYTNHLNNGNILIPIFLKLGCPKTSCDILVRYSDHGWNTEQNIWKRTRFGQKSQHNGDRT